MPRLHLPYDKHARKMSKSPFPCRLRRETLRSSYGFTGIVASTILFNSAQWQIWKNRKPVARRHIAVTSYYPRRGTARWSWGQRTILDCHFGPKMIIDSCDSRKEPARSPYNGLAGPTKSYRHRTSTCGNPKAMAQWSCGCLATCQQFPDVSSAVCFMTILVLRRPLRVTQYGPRSVCWWKQSNQGP